MGWTGRESRKWCCDREKIQEASLNLVRYYINRTEGKLESEEEVDENRPASGAGWL